MSAHPRSLFRRGRFVAVLPKMGERGEPLPTAMSRCIKSPHFVFREDTCRVVGASLLVFFGVSCPSKLLQQQ